VTDRSSKRSVDVASTVPGGPISCRHPPPQHPARRAWSVLRFSETPATTSTRRWQAAHASSLNDLQPAPSRRVLAVLIPPDPAARTLLYRCALLPEVQPPLTRRLQYSLSGHGRRRAPLGPRTPVSPTAIPRAGLTTRMADELGPSCGRGYAGAAGLYAGRMGQVS
jgi:hypothetical protein